MVLVKILMEIDPLSMRGSLVMMVTLIFPSRREVSPAERIHRSPRLLLPRFRLEMAALLPESFLMIFFQGKRHHIAEDGHRGSSRWPTRQGARPPRSWIVGGPPLVLSSPYIFNIFQNWLSWSFRTFGVVQNRSLIFSPFPAQNSSCWHSPSSCKPCKIREKRHKYSDIMCNNSPKCNKYRYKSMMQNGRIS